MKYKERVPNGNLPICRVEGGSIVCLNIHNESINFWDHDTELIDENIYSANPLIKVANSFTDFLNVIKPYDHDEGLGDYKVEDVWIDPDFFKEINDDKG